MTETFVIELAHKTLMVALMLSLPVLAFALAAGVIVSVFQAVTQIQEMTLSFIPKILAAVAAIALFGPWMIKQMVSFTQWLFSNIPNMVG